MHSLQPKWWSWYYWLDPLSYALYGIIGSQLSDVQDLVDYGDGTKPVTVQQFVKESLDFKESFVWACALILIGFNIMFVFIFMLAVAKLNFSQR